jgi:hypothetical protein
MTAPGKHRRPVPSKAAALGALVAAVLAAQKPKPREGGKS